MASTSTGFYRNPYLSTIAFTIGILLFFLPFMEIKCNGTSMAALSGKAMVFGTAPSVGKDVENMTKTMSKYDTAKKTATSGGDGKVYIAAVIALLLGLVGLGFSLIKNKSRYLPIMIAGALGALALVVLMFQVKASVNASLNDAMDNKASSMGGASEFMHFSADMTFWFYLCVLSFIAAAFFSYKQRSLLLEDALPPLDAPQVPIDNLGEQSDFPAAPTGDIELG